MKCFRGRNVSKLTHIALFFLMIGVGYVGCAKQTQQPQGLTLVEGVLSVGVEVGYPPMEYLADDSVTLIGFDIDMTKVIAEKLGLQIKFIDTAWEGILTGLNAGKYDIAVNITILPERQKRYNFSKPYIDSSMTIVALKNSAIKIEKAEDIEGYTVAYQTDTTAQYFTEKLQERGVNVKAFAYDKILNCFDDLRAGRVDVIVVDNIVAYDYTGKENCPFEVIWNGPSDEFIGICLKKGNDTLTAAINKALDELFDDGTMLDISLKFFSRDLISSVRYRL